MAEGAGILAITEDRWTQLSFSLDERGIIRCRKGRISTGERFVEISLDRTSVLIHADRLDELRSCGVRTNSPDTLINLMVSWTGRKWSALLEEKRRRRQVRQAETVRRQRRQEADKALPPALADLLVAPSKDFGVDKHERGFRVSILCRSTNYDGHTAFVAIQQNQDAFVKWVRTMIETLPSFMRQIGSLNAYRLSRYTVRATPEVIVMFDLLGQR